MNYASIWRRTAAYFVDVIPITLGVFAVYYSFLGLDETMHAMQADRENLELRAQFYAERNQVRNLAALIWVLYCCILEASPMAGTLGKVLLGIKVVDRDGYRISFMRSVVRNFSKFVSLLPCALGFIWAVFSRDKQAWHDKIASTYVTRSD